LTHLWTLISLRAQELGLQSRTPLGLGQACERCDQDAGGNGEPEGLWHGSIPKMEIVV